MAEVNEAPMPTTEVAKGPTKNIAHTAPPAAPAALLSSPFTFMRRFTEEMEHLFEDFGLGLGFGWRMPSALTRGRELLGREVGLIPAEWSPRVDIRQRN